MFHKIYVLRVWLNFSKYKRNCSDVLTTCTVVIFRVKLRCITSVDGIILWFLGSYTRVFIVFDQLIRHTKKILCVTHHQFHHRSGWPFVIFLNKNNAPNKGTNVCSAKGIWPTYLLQLIARGSDQLKILNYFGLLAHFTFSI